MTTRIVALSLVPALVLVLVGSGPALAQNAFPVVTHYPVSGGTTADTTRRVTPGYDAYSAAVTDECAPTQQEMNVAGQLIFQAAGVQATFLNDPAALVEGAATIQVVSNWAIGAALYTVAVPAGWRRATTYPIVLSPNPTTYSNNYRVFRAQEAGVLGFAAARGFISVFSNAGGIESQGVSDGVLRSVGQALDTFVTLGGDKHRVVTAGFSRGAQDAFVWAANPLDLDYTVIAAFGHALPTSLLEAVTSPYATYPWLGWLSDTVTNDASLSRYDHAPPPHTIPNRIAEILTGQGTAEVRSALALVERLRGKQLVYSVSSHDSVVPYRAGVAFTRALEAAGIPAMAVLAQNTGHMWSIEVVNELSEALTEIGAGRAYTAPSGRVYTTQTNLQTHDYSTQSRVVRATMPFSVVLPFRAAVGQPMRVDLCGAPGTRFLVCAVLDGTAETSSIFFFGEIPAEECISQSLPAPLVTGSYNWNVVLNNLGVPRSQTPLGGLRPTLLVDPVQPAHFAAMPTQLPVMMGLSELSAQTGEVSIGCPPSANAPLTDGGVEDSGFQIGGDGGSVDTGVRDAGFFDLGVVDSGNRKPAESGCGCTSGPGAGQGGDGALIVLMLGLVMLRRRAR